MDLSVEFRNGYQEITAGEFSTLPFEELLKHLADNYDIVRNEETGTAVYKFKGESS